MIHSNFGLRSEADLLSAALGDVDIGRSDHRRFSQQDECVQQPLFRRVKTPSLTVLSIETAI